MPETFSAQLQRHKKFSSLRNEQNSSRKFTLNRKLHSLHNNEVPCCLRVSFPRPKFAKQFRASFNFFSPLFYLCALLSRNTLNRRFYRVRWLRIWMTPINQHQQPVKPFKFMLLHDLTQATVKKYFFMPKCDSSPSWSYAKEKRFRSIPKPKRRGEREWLNTTTKSISSLWIICYTDRFMLFYVPRDSVGVERASLSINGALCWYSCNIRTHGIGSTNLISCFRKRKTFRQEEKLLLRGKMPTRVLVNEFSQSAVPSRRKWKIFLRRKSGGKKCLAKH